jgi:hypothetical protein
MANPYITPEFENRQDNFVKVSPDFYTLAPHQFIETLFSDIPDGWVEVTCLAPEGSTLYPRTYVMWFPLPLGIGSIDPNMPGVMKMNAKGYCCYVAPAVRNRIYEPEQRTNERGRQYTVYPRGKALDAIWIKALWVDIDVPGEEGYHQLIENLVPPSITINTGGGWHGYWLLEQPLAITDDNRDMVKRTLKGMALACGGDTKVADFARIMRIPGTVNTKPGRGQTCEVYDFIPSHFHYMDMELGYAPFAAPKIPDVQRELPAHAFEHIPHWVSNYITNGRPEGQRNQTLFQAACDCFNNGMGMGEVEGLLRGRAVSDGLNEHEITATITSALNHPRGDSKLPRYMAQRMGAADRRLSQKGVQ